MSELLLKEKVLFISALPVKLRGKFNGALRFIDKSGKTFGLFLDKDAMEDMLEKIEFSSPEFWKKIKASRQSGAVSAKEVRKSIGLV